MAQLIITIFTLIASCHIGIRDLDYHDSDSQAQGRKKEGILYAFKSYVGPTGTVNPWKKYWCVLSGGQIHEYVHWKDNMKLNNTIDLKFCTVREARSTDRRFCFEIISTQFKRVYQATSQEEMVQWICVIGNAIESVLNGTSSNDNLVPPYPSSNPDSNTNNSLTLLDDLRSRDSSNLFCADCGAKNPDWCSINLSVLLCIGNNAFLLWIEKSISYCISV